MKYIFVILFCASMSQMAYSQNVPFECPPCRSFTSCGQCWTNAQEATDAGCTAGAARTVNQISFENEEAFEQPDLEIFPNPNDGSFFIKSKTELAGNIVIINQYGVKVKSFALRGKILKTEYLKLPVGMYQLIYTDPKSGKKVTKRLMIN